MLDPLKCSGTDELNLDSAHSGLYGAAESVVRKVDDSTTSVPVEGVVTSLDIIIGTDRLSIDAP